MRIYIADDSDIVAERVADMLSRDLPDVELIGRAMNATEAKEGIGKLKPDVVILDIQMPGGSGIDVLVDVKKDAGAPKVVILTNYPYPQYRKRCLEAGADFFFDKSTEFDRLPDALRNLMQGSTSPGKGGAMSSSVARRGRLSEIDGAFSVAKRREKRAWRTQVTRRFCMA